MMKPLLILVSLFGLMAGPGYLGYCSLISGAAHESVNLYEADVGSASVKGVKVTHSKGGEWNNAVSLELSPDLNPINLSLSCRYVKPASRREVRSAFAAKLKSDDKTIWEQDVNVRIKSKKIDGGIEVGGWHTLSRDLTTLSVERAGTYEFLINPEKPSEITFSKVTLEVRRNVLIPSIPFVLLGFVALFGGVTGFVNCGKLH